MADARTPPGLLDFACPGAWIQVFKSVPGPRRRPVGTASSLKGSGVKPCHLSCSSCCIRIKQARRERSLRITLDIRQDLCQSPPLLCGRIRALGGLAEPVALARWLFDIRWTPRQG